MHTPDSARNFVLWLLAHKATVSISGIAALGGIAVRIWNWLNDRKLLRCTRTLRVKADRMRFLSDNPAPQFSIQFLKDSLGEDGKHITRVIEFMEKRGWAKKIPGGVGLWEIN